METGSPDGVPRIVVGVDGSEASLRALEFAAEEARLRRASLHVIRAFPAPTAAGIPVPVEYFDELEAEARRELDLAVDAVPACAGAREVVRTVVAESPVSALLAASSEADILVVGSRGRGGFSALVLGSVSQQCVQHAQCPVVIVR